MPKVPAVDPTLHNGTGVVLATSSMVPPARLDMCGQPPLMPGC